MASATASYPAPCMTRKDTYLFYLREMKETLYQGAIRHDKRTALLCAITVLAVVGVLLGVYQPHCHQFFLTAAGKSTLIGLGTVGASSLLWIFWPAVNGEPFKSQLRPDLIERFLRNKYFFEKVAYHKGERGEIWVKRTPKDDVVEIHSLFASYKHCKKTELASLKDFIRTPFVRNRAILLVAMTILATLGALLGVYHVPFQNFFLSYAGKWTIGALACVGGASLLWIVWPLITYKHSKLPPDTQNELNKRKMKFHHMTFSENKFGEQWRPHGLKGFTADGFTWRGKQLEKLYFFSPYNSENTGRNAVLNYGILA